MSRLRLLVMLVLSGTGAAQSPMIRAHLEPSRSVIVGEPVRLVVTVMVPNYFAGSPQFPEFELENAIVVLPQETPQNSSERLGGVTYAGITEVYTLYPQQSGDFELPPAQIDVPYASAPPKTTLGHLTLPPLRLHADIPAAASGLDYFLPTTSLTMQERWSPAPNSVRVGDTLERTITVTAAKMQAMLIPPLPLNAPDGIRVYQEEPAVQDKKSSRSEFLYGRRTQSARYLIRKEGSYTLPAIELKWWNLSNRRLMSAVLPPIHFVARASPGATSELPPEQPAPADAQIPKRSRWTQHKRQLYIATVWTLIVLVVMWMAVYWLPKLLRYIHDWKERRRSSEHAFFRTLLRACKDNQPAETYAALLNWLNRSDPRRSVDEFSIPLSPPELTNEIDRLGVLLFSSSARKAQWSGQHLSELLRAYRKQHVRFSRKKSFLAPLNPHPPC